MAISLAQMKSLCRVVAKDTKSSKQISSMFSILPSRAGVSGGIRNYLMAFANIYSNNKYYDPTEEETNALVCTGIASTTAAAINAAKKHKPAEYTWLKLATTINRRPPIVDIDHTATLIEMEDGSSYVFDWHATLDVNDPLVSHPKEWAKGHNGPPMLTLTNGLK